MKIRILISVLVLVAAPNFFGQTTALTASVVDSQSVAWANGPYTVTFIGSGAGTPYTKQGQAFTQQFQGTLNGSGQLSITVTDVNNIIPVNSNWKICVTPAVSSPTTYCVTLPVTGASYSASLAINAIIQPPAVTGLGLASAYADSEVSSLAGTMYYNVTANTFRCFTTAWGLCGAGGGGPPTGAAGGVLAGTYPNPGFTALTPTITEALFGGLTGCTTTNNVLSPATGICVTPSTGTVTSTSGTTNQIDVATGTTTPVISLDPAIILPGTLKGAQVNAQRYADGAPSSCTTTSGGALTHQADCAFYQARDAAVASGNSVDLNFGNGFYLAFTQWVEPPAGFYSVNLKGAAMNSTFLLIETSLGSVPFLFKTAGNAYLTVRDLTINANNDANSCMDLFFLDGFQIENVNCEHVLTGSDHALQIGSPSGFALDGVIRNLITSPPYNIGQTYASLTATGSTSVTGITINSGGNYPNSSQAVGIVNDPHQYCVGNEPTFTPTFTGTAITGTTITNAGTCSGGLPDLAVMQQQSLTTAGMRLYVSDSTIQDIQPNVGITGAIIYGGNNTILHPHPTAIQNGLVINNSGNAFIESPELDTIGTAGIIFSTTQQVVVSGVIPYTGNHALPGSAIFQFGSTSDNVAITGEGDLCPGGAPADYQEFIGPSGILVTGTSGWPTGVSVTGHDKSCAVAGVTANTDYKQVQALGAPPLNTVATIASAATIAPVTSVVDITGSTTIETITPPTLCTTSGIDCTLTMIFDGAASLGTTGNIQAAVTINAGESAFLVYSPTGTGCTSEPGCWYTPVTGASSGTLTGSGTSGTCAAWTGTSSLGNGTCFVNPMTTLGDIIYGGASGTGTRLAGVTSSTLSVLASQGSGGVAAAPAWLTTTGGSGSVVRAASPSVSGNWLNSGSYNAAGFESTSTGYYGFSSTTANNGTIDSVYCRLGAAGVVGVEAAATCTNTTAGATAQFWAGTLNANTSVTTPLLATTTNCSSSASPAVCAAAPSGSVALPTNAVSSSVQVNTTAVTANSQIFVMTDDTLGTKLGVTCNSTVATLVGGLTVSARSAGSSFTVSNNVAVVTNPLCVSYFIVN